jgi:hypothetical protein
MIMSSYALLARLSSVEGSTDDLQTARASLEATKQDTIDNAQVIGVQAILDGLSETRSAPRTAP